MKKPTSKHEDDKEEQEEQSEMFTPVKHKIQVSDSPEMDPPLKQSDEKLLSKVTKEEKLAAREKAKGEAQK